MAKSTQEYDYNYGDGTHAYIHINFKEGTGKVRIIGYQGKSYETIYGLPNINIDYTKEKLSKSEVQTTQILLYQNSILLEILEEQLDLLEV